MNPKNGIPKEISISCMVSVPKFESKFEQFQSSNVKESARNFSINTLRSQVDLSIDENAFQGLPGFAKREEKSKDIKGLLKTVLSTSTLTRSLEKLGNISRSISPQAKGMQPKTFGSKDQTSSREKISLRDRAVTANSSVSRQKKLRENPPKLATNVYIMEYKREIISSYILNTGYVGTYQPNYKLLYNKREDLYFEAVGEGDLKRLKGDTISNNENIENRKKFLKYYNSYPVECQPFVNTGRIVYLRRTFQVKSENIIMFKFSNNTIQVRQNDLNKNLLIGKDELILITLEKGVVTNQIKCSKEGYIDCADKDLIHLYLKFKKISLQINNTKK